MGKYTYSKSGDYILVIAKFDILSITYLKPVQDIIYKYIIYFKK